LYLVGSDNLHIKKNDEFIIYQGSHGDKNAEIADIILPGAAYTEQDGLFTNLEGRVQECRKASYPPNEAMEDWKIFDLIYKNLKNSNLFNNFISLRETTIKNIPNFSNLDQLPNKELKKIEKASEYFANEKIEIKPIDYYFSNSIARSSKTMSDCRNVLLENKKNGTTN
jgi:NADH-quinone oxidoreductase subunit G